MGGCTSNKKISDVKAKRVNKKPFDTQRILVTLREKQKEMIEERKRELRMRILYKKNLNAPKLNIENNALYKHRKNSKKSLF